MNRSSFELENKWHACYFCHGCLLSWL